MKRSWMIVAALSGMILAVSAPPAAAEGIKAFFHRIAEDTRRNNAWPDCFVPQDRFAATSPLELMVKKGWMGQNLISEQHFHQDTGNLTQAGKLKIEWILTEAPSTHRTIYVRQAAKPEETQQRLEAVQKWASEVVGPEGGIDIEVVRMSPPGWPAEMVDSLERKYMETLPAPRLPKLENGGGAINLP
ncbi:MAG: hypothetical protein ACUVTW_07170 [Thermogutta sp.]